MMVVQKIRKKIIAFLLMIALSGSECAYALRKPSASEDLPPLVIVYETDMGHTNLVQLKSWLLRFGYEVAFLGAGEQWQGFGQKIRAVRSYLQDEDPERMIVFCDARDVLPLRSAKDLQQKMQELQQRNIWHKDTILMGVEVYPAVTLVRRMHYYYPGSIFARQAGKVIKHHNIEEVDWLHWPLRALETLWPEKSPKMHWMRHFKWPYANTWSGQSPYAVLNSGLYIAKAGTLQKVLKEIAAKPREDDQQLFSEYWHARPEAFSFDFEREVLYHCAPQWRTLPGYWRKNRWYHEDDKAPFFIHFFSKNIAAQRFTLRQLQQRHRLGHQN